MVMKDWISEQREQKGMFRGSSKSNDADRLLEISPTNRNLGAKQAKIFISARLINDSLGITCIKELCDMAEKAQLCIDKDSRKDFMKVAIEQWQGKLANTRNKVNLEALL